MIADLVKRVFAQGHVAAERSISETLVFVDDSFAEASRWEGERASNEDELRVYPLTRDLDAMQANIHSILDDVLQENETEAFRSPRQWLLVLCTASLDAETVSAAQHLLNSLSLYTSESEGRVLFFPECVILTSVSPAALSLYSYPSTGDGSEEDSPYDRFLEFLSPSLPTKVLYAPCHSIDVLRAEEERSSSCREGNNKEFSLRMLASHSVRSLSPLMLHRLSTNTGKPQPRWQRVQDISAADLPVSVRNALKAFSHELAATLVFDLNLDVSSSLFALGKTSSLIAHNLHKSLESLKIFHNNSPSFILHSDSSLERTFPSLSRASCILVDRTEDLFSVSSFSGSDTQPLAHRVLNALKFPRHHSKGHGGTQEAKKETAHESAAEIHAPFVDVSLEPLTFSIIENALSEERASESTMESLFQPMSAMTSLSLHLPPSICFHPDEGNDANDPTHTDKLREIFLSHPEERCRQVLCDALTKAIQSENGVLPASKKRGLGAEVLAYTQALLDSPGRAGEGRDIVSCRHQQLLSLCLAVIETMQRSSQKQFVSLCDWKCALDVRAARENDFLLSLQSPRTAVEDFEMISAKLFKSFLIYQQKTTTTSALSSSFTSGTASSVTSPVKSKTPSGKTSKAAPKEDPKEGPVDPVHVVLQMIGFISLFRYTMIPDTFTDTFAGYIAQYLIESERIDEELSYWQRLGLISSSTALSVTELISLNKEDPNDSYMIALEDVLTSEMLRPLSELCSHYSHISSSLEEKELLSDLSRSPYELLRFCLSKARNDYAMPFTPRGLVATMVDDCLQFRSERDITLYHPASEFDATLLPRLLEHVDGSLLQQMAKTGLNMLSKGLGRFGFGFGERSTADSNHPGNNDVIVITIVGGISLKEVSQVRQVILDYKAKHPMGNATKKVILVSHNILNAEDVISLVF